MWFRDICITYFFDQILCSILLFNLIWIKFQQKLGYSEVICLLSLPHYVWGLNPDTIWLNRVSISFRTPYKLEKPLNWCTQLAQWPILYFEKYLFYFKDFMKSWTKGRQRAALRKAALRKADRKAALRKAALWKADRKADRKADKKADWKAAQKNNIFVI